MDNSVSPVTASAIAQLSPLHCRNRCTPLPVLRQCCCCLPRCSPADDDTQATLKVYVSNQQGRRAEVIARPQSFPVTVALTVDGRVRTCLVAHENKHLYMCMCVSTIALRSSITPTLNETLQAKHSVITEHINTKV